MMMQSNDDDQSSLLQNESPSHEIDANILGLKEEVPSARSLLRSQPYHHGYLTKKRERCCGLCISMFPPLWKRRFFIISGRFLYRFSSDTGAAPKGVPIPLEGADFHVLDDELVPYAFSVSIVSKELILAAESNQQRREWIEELRISKQRAIKETMGHVKERTDHARFNKMGSTFFKRKLSREHREAVTDPSMIEMRAFSSGGGHVDPLY